jgi:TorA maturation chaperone TorD
VQANPIRESDRAFSRDTRTPTRRRSIARRFGRHRSDLIDRAALLRTLACGFAAPLDGRAAEVRRALKQLAHDHRDSFDRVSCRMRSADRAWHTSSERDISRAYAAFFSSAVPLREVAYGNAKLSGRVVDLADVAGFYRMFGFPVVESDAEPPDHLSIELDFVGWLLAKEAYARAHGLKAQARATAFAACIFLEQHLGRWVEALVRRVKKQGIGTPYYELAELLTAAVAIEARRHACDRWPQTSRDSHGREPRRRRIVNLRK